LAHRYVTFRLRLAQHALRQFGASLKSSAEIVLLVFGQVLIGLFAVIALPPMYAASLPFHQSLPLLTAHALVMTIPLWLLRKRVLPQDVVHWLHPLPVPRNTQLAADALVAGMLIGPLALAYAVSSAIWLYHRPEWLQPARAVPGVVLSLLLTWACSTAILTRRAHLALPDAGWQRRLAAAPVRYTPHSPGSRVLVLWHRLFWLPFWRAENVVGWQQSVLLLAALGSALGWMMSPPGVLRASLDLCTSAVLVLLTDRGDKAVREQIGVLRPVMAAWPMPARALELLARAFSLVPALLVLAVLFGLGVGPGVWDRTAGPVYLGLACLASLLLVAVPSSNARARVGLVGASIVVLTAVGSEIWN
jgi:hypothetical protein